MSQNKCIVRLVPGSGSRLGPKQSNQATARPLRQIRNFTTHNAKIASTDLERERYLRESLAAGCVRVDVKSVRSYHHGDTYSPL